MELVSGSVDHNSWLRAKVLQAREDRRPNFEDADTEAEARFCERRAAALRKVGAGNR